MFENWMWWSRFWVGFFPGILDFCWSNKGFLRNVVYFINLFFVRIVVVVTWRILISILKGWFKDNFSLVVKTRFDTVFLTIYKCKYIITISFVRWVWIGVAVNFGFFSLSFLKRLVRSRFVLVGFLRGVRAGLLVRVDVFNQSRLVNGIGLISGSGKDFF